MFSQTCSLSVRSGGRDDWPQAVTRAVVLVYSRCNCSSTSSNENSIDVAGTRIPAQTDPLRCFPQGNVALFPVSRNKRHSASLVFSSVPKRGARSQRAEANQLCFGPENTRSSTHTRVTCFGLRYTTTLVSSSDNFAGWYRRLLVRRGCHGASLVGIVSVMILGSLEILLVYLFHS